MSLTNIFISSMQNLIPKSVKSSGKEEMLENEDALSLKKFKKSKFQSNSKLY